MGDLLNGLISFLLGAIAGTQPSEVRMAARTIAVVLALAIWTLFIYRPLARKLRRAEPGSVDRDLGYGWIVSYVLIAVGPWLGFEIWPSVVLSLLIVRALDGRGIGPFKRIPGYRSALDYATYMHLACVASYHLPVQHAEGDGWWRRSTRELREATASSGTRNDTVVTLVIGMAISSFWTVLGVVLLFQPAGTLASGGSAADIPTDVYCSLGSGMICQYMLLLVVLAIAFEACRYGDYAGARPPDSSEVSAARERLRYLRNGLGGWGRLFLKATFMAVVGGGGFALQAFRVFSRPLGISLRLQDILNHLLQG